MEEVKNEAGNEAGKVVNMPAKAKSDVRKLSYEELENIANQLSEQNRQLYQRSQQLENALNQANMSNYFKRLDYLWAVVKDTTPYIAEEFKFHCGEEITVMMTPAEEGDQNPPEDSEK